MVILGCGAGVQTARADEVGIFSVNATPTFGSGLLTGTFTLDLTNGQVTAWDIVSSGGGGPMTYNNAGHTLDELPPYIDTATVVPSSGSFAIDFGKEFWIPDPTAGKLRVDFSLGLVFAGSPNTFSGGPFVGDEFGDYWYNFEKMVQWEGSAVLIATPEPSTLMLLGLGLMGLLGFAITKATA
jgi:hypothetical protein